jgi:hypothetical protein
MEIRMKIVLAGAFAALTVAGATVVATLPAQAGLNFGVTIDAGNVMFAYRDGYWDRWHRWHPWADPADWRWYRAHYAARYFDWVHTRDPDMGWRVGVVGGAPGIGVAVGAPGVGVAVGAPGVGVAVGAPAVGVAVGTPGLSFAVTDVAFAYRDGWWDRWHRWHVWRNAAERDWWRAHYAARYWDWRHDRDASMGWHANVNINVP